MAASVILTTVPSLIGGYLLLGLFVFLLYAIFVVLVVVGVVLGVYLLYVGAQVAGGKVRCESSISETQEGQVEVTIDSGGHASKATVVVDDEPVHVFEPVREGDSVVVDVEEGEDVSLRSEYSYIGFF